MNLILVGKINNTHGLNGEVKITSNFEYKNKVFKKGFKVYIDKEEYIINSYRTMNKYDLIVFKNLDHIDKVSFLKNKLIYINRDDLKVNDYIIEDLLDFEIICNNEFYGKVIDYDNGINKLLKIRYNKDYYIPLKGEFIIKVDLDNKKIYVSDDIKELIL